MDRSKIQHLIERESTACPCKVLVAVTYTRKAGYALRRARGNVFSTRICARQWGPPWGCLGKCPRAPNTQYPERCVTHIQVCKLVELSDR